MFLHNFGTAPRQIVRLCFLSLLMTSVILPAPAYAQIAKLNAVMTMVQTALLSIAVVAFTIAILWAGYKMAFQHAKWSEVANIVIGGVFVGGAAAIATLLVGTV